MGKLLTEDILFERIANYNAAFTATAVGSMSEGMPIKIIAEVVNVEDNMKQCRIKAHIQGFTKSDESSIPDDDLPWCYADMRMMNMFDAPIVGDYVWLDMSKGIYNATWMHIDSKSQALKDLIGDENNNAKVVVYDDGTRYGAEGMFGLWWTPNQGWNILYNESRINIRQDKSIIIYNASGTIHLTAEGKISLGTEDKSAKSGVLGEDNVTSHENTLAYIAEVVDNIGSVMQQLSQLAKANPYTSSLSPGFDAYSAKVKTPSQSTNKKCKDQLPDTLSEIVSLD